MIMVHILLTDPLAERLEPFVHDNLRLLFDRLDADGPRRLVDGPVWAFVDWAMPTMSGLEMCRRLRADPRTENAHVTMVLEADDAEDRRRALRAGADDYLVGPVDRRLVLDRVLALHARQQQRHLAQLLEQGPLSIDLAALQARWAGRPITLRPNEYRLLRYFAEHPDQVLSRGALIAGLGKQEPPIDERTVDVWVGRLRRALKESGAGNPLRTVRSMGYVLDLK